MIRVLLFLFAFSGMGWAQECAPTKPDPLAGFELLDASRYADLPDAVTQRATSGIETELVDKMLRREVPYFSKTWCQISINRFIVDFHLPVEDDAVEAMVTRAVFVWDASDEPAGWRIEQLGERPKCARGDDAFANSCP